MVRVALSEVAGQAFVDGPMTKDQQVIDRSDAVCDIKNEPLQVFEAARLAGGLRATTAAAVTDGRIVPDVASRPVVRRHLGRHSFDPCPAAAQADDRGRLGVDPHHGAGRCIGIVSGPCRVTRS